MTTFFLSLEYLDIAHKLSILWCFLCHFSSSTDHDHSEQCEDSSIISLYRPRPWKT